MAVIKDLSKDETNPQINFDEARHREKVKEAIKKNIDKIIAEEPILTSDGKKIIKVKIQSIKEHRFIFGEEGEGSGQLVEGEGKEGGKSTIPSSGAGNTPGIDFLEETEIKLEEIIDLMLEDLELTDFWKTLESESKKKFQPAGKRKSGSYVRLSKKETVKRRIARTRAEEKISKMIKRTGKPRFLDGDKRYRHLKELPDEDTRAVVFCIMDVSGSMDDEKKYLARAFYFLLVSYLKKKKYDSVETVFICHDTEAREKDEAEFFKTGSSGGTHISSGQEKALEIMEEKYKGQNINFYVFHATDGDNFSEDNEKLVQVLQKVCKKANLVGLAEIKAFGSTFDRVIGLRHLADQNPHFMILEIKQKDDVGPTLKRFLSHDKGGAQ